MSLALRLSGAFGGLAAGLGVVVATAAAVDSALPAPKFSPSALRFDTSSFGGRFASMLTVMDPSTLLASDEQVKAAHRLLEDYEKGKAGPRTDKELWDAKKLRDSAMHPDTKEIIPGPFRMAGYVPYNGPVCMGMMLSTTTPSIVFFNWVNQSQNALVNYFNRNASSPTTNEVLAQSYATAVTAALCVALGVSTLVKRSFNADTANKLLRFVALPSSMVASSANCYVMRSPEIKAGISLIDADGKEIVPGARSQVAARKAVMETVYSRVLLQLPTFFLPPVFMMVVPAAVAAAPVTGLALNTFVTIVGFGLGLPAAVAVFPQVGELLIEELEQDSEAKRVCEARGLKAVYYNKGL